MTTPHEKPEIKKSLKRVTLEPNLECRLNGEPVKVLDMKGPYMTPRFSAQNVNINTIHACTGRYELTEEGIEKLEDEIVEKLGSKRFEGFNAYQIGDVLVINGDYQHHGSWANRCVISYNLLKIEES